MKNKLLSVIIPIYNVEKYLSKCLESVINQTYKELEIILVNDGSTDNCKEICEKYKREDPRIIVINKENGGLASARNTGLEIATGDYLAFLDSDDYIENSMYETLISLLLEYNADVASCSFNKVYSAETIPHSNTGEIKTYDRHSAIKELLHQKNIRFEVWNKVYTKNIIGNTRFKDKQIFEDVYFERCVFMKMNKLIFIDKPLHNYLLSREGNTNSNFKKEKLYVFKEFEDFINVLKRNEMFEEAKHIQAFSLGFVIGLFVQAVDLGAPLEIQQKLKKIFEDIYKESRENSYYNRRNVFLFRLSPELFINLIRIKRLYNKFF